MRPNHLVALGVAAALLLVLFLVFQARQEPSTDLPPVYDLLEKSFQPSEIASVNVRIGPEGEGEGRSLRLVRRDERWTVEDRPSAAAGAPPAPADDSWVDQLFESLQEVDKGGEVRSRSAEVHADFRVTDDEGIHLELVGRDGEVRHHLIVGKRGSNWSSTFVRRAGSDEVVLVRTPLRNRLRVRGSDDEPKVEASAWWKLRLFDLDHKDVARLEVEGPEAAARVVVREQPGGGEQEEEAAAEGGPSEEEGAEEEGAEPEEEEEPMEEPEPEEPTWVVAEGEALEDPERLVRNLATARAMKVAPPDAETGLGKGRSPAAVIRAETAEGGTLILEFGAEAPDAEGARYVRRGGEEIVYVLPSYAVQNLLAPEE